MKSNQISILMKTEQARALLKNGVVSVLECVSPNLTKKSTYIESMLYIHDEGNFYIPKYRVGDYLSIREPFMIDNGVIRYKADFPDEEANWKSSVNMNDKQSRMNATVVDVYAKRLHDMKKSDFVLAGFKSKSEFVVWWKEQLRNSFREVPSRKKRYEVYGWDANPFVWVYVLEKNE